MVNGNDQAVLIDFGASKQYDEMNGENTSTLIGQTPGYAPLEQIGNDVVRFFPATDIYSLGATLYKLLSGDTPLSASLLASGEELKPLSVNITEQTRTAVTAAMTVNKNKRPQTIADFLILLGDEDNAHENNLNVENRESKNQFNEREETLVIGEATPKVTQPKVEFVNSPSPKTEGVKLGRIILTICGICVLIGVIGVFIGFTVGRDNNVYEEAYRKATEQSFSTESAPSAKQTSNQTKNTQNNTQSTTTNQVQSAENKTEEVTIDQNAVTLRNALNNNDYKTVQRLANSGYAASYGPLAKYYLQNNEYELAETYAKKAKAAGYSDGTTVITTLTQLGYYD
jgi:serine/threonine protein kinase